MGCQQSVPTTTTKTNTITATNTSTTNTNINVTTPPTSGTAPTAATVATPTPAKVNDTPSADTIKTANIPATTTESTPPTTTTAVVTVPTTDTTMGNTKKDLQQRQPARNIFAKPLQVVTNVATTAATSAVTNVTNALDQLTMMGVRNKKLPYYEKTPDVMKFLMEAIQQNFIFENCSHNELQQLCCSMEPQTNIPIETVIIQQGEPIGDYFYVIYSGTVTYIVDGKVVGTATTKESFGELSLLYSAPRAATVQTSSDNVTLYRLDQITFRTILQQQTTDMTVQYIDILKKVQFLSQLDDYSLHKLAAVVQVQTYEKDTVIIKKGDSVTTTSTCYILVQGSVLVSDISVSGSSYSDMVLNDVGNYFGERAIMTNEPRAATITAISDVPVICYTIDQITFNTILGDYESIINKANDERLLASIPIISESKFPVPVLKSMTKLVKEQSYDYGTKICEQNVTTYHPALYLVRSGYFTITKVDGSLPTVIGPGGYFGDDQLMYDANKIQMPDPEAIISFTPSCTITAGDTTSTHSDSTTESAPRCGIITLSALRTIIDTRYIGTPVTTDHKDSLMDQSIVLSKLQRHTVLGAGTFGMVYLVSRTNSAGERIAYAMKVQSKYELCKDGQAAAVINEKNIMSKLHHPFLIGLINTYQDETFVYILLQLIQGGELYSYIHTKTQDYVSENSARFYAACIADGLGHMHKNGFVYRDLKPENVLVDNTGYCVVIDFGFAKYVPIPSKTFTLCGTPLYIAPEVILNRGHNSCADHWSLGILIHELLYGDNPFYKHGMDQMDLFRSIVKARYTTPSSHNTVSDEAIMMIKALLARDPSKRLGSLADGEDGILFHPWFTKYGMDMDQLRKKKYKAPVIPKVKDPLDSSNFENWDHLEDKTKKKYPPLSDEDKLLFDGF